MCHPHPRFGRCLGLGVVCAALFASSTSPAYCYVDPGILGTLYQIGYIVVFGILMGVVLRPFRFLKDSLGRIKRYFKPNVREDNSSHH